MGIFTGLYYNEIIRPDYNKKTMGLDAAGHMNGLPLAVSQVDLKKRRLIIRKRQNVNRLNAYINKYITVGKT